jgi:hypothetical protein
MQDENQVLMNQEIANRTETGQDFIATEIPPQAYGSVIEAMQDDGKAQEVNHKSKWFIYEGPFGGYFISEYDYLSDDGAVPDIIATESAFKLGSFKSEEELIYEVLISSRSDQVISIGTCFVLDSNAEELTNRMVSLTKSIFAELSSAVEDFERRNGYTLPISSRIREA